MNKYVAPVRDIAFALFDVVEADRLYAQLPGGEAVTRDLVDAVLQEGARFTETVLAPLNATGDSQGCVFDPATGTVTTPHGFR